MILIIDDDKAIRSSLEFLLRRAGYEPRAVASPREAVDFVHSVVPDLVLMDMNYSLTTTGEEGIFLLKQMKIFCPDTPVILMTAWGSIQLAVEGMRAGAFDFITKPWNNLVLLKTIQTALELCRLQNTTIEGSPDVSGFAGVNIIGKSRALQQVLETVKKIAPTNASVLITGESGTGKELIAEALHNAGLRPQGPFVKVNLGGISQSLFESEMFGHKKGAFTDAYTDRTGRFQLADKGTIFLDEIGDLDMSCQVKLLRVLQDQTFEVLGESRMRKVDVRVICATNRDLKQMVAERTFREDLFYRISLIPVHLPPLRERSEDIPLLAHHFAGKITAEQRIPPVEFTKEALDYLQTLPYRGNIRELKNLVERTVLISGKMLLETADFKKAGAGTAYTTAENNNPGWSVLEMKEKIEVEKAMARHENNVTKAAKALGISRAALYRRLEKYK